MKKILIIFLGFSLACILSSCPRETSTTYKTIKSARALLFSFNEYGIYPYLEDFDKNELGIGIYPDSIHESFELAQFNSLSSRAHAMEDPNQIIYTNSIESINIITIYDFDDEHPAGSTVNDILLHLDSMGNTTTTNINKLSSELHHFKFSAVPLNDSLQFEILGRITNEKDFKVRTELVIIN